MRCVESKRSWSSKTLIFNNLSINNWPIGLCTLTWMQSVNLMKPVEEVDSGVQGLVAAPLRPGFTGDHAHAEHSKKLERERWKVL